MENLQSYDIPKNQSKSFKLISCLTLWVYIINFVVSPVYASAADVMVHPHDPAYSAASLSIQDHPGQLIPAEWKNDADFEVQFTSRSELHKEDFLLSLRMSNQDLGNFVFDPAQDHVSSVFKNIYDDSGILCAWQFVHSQPTPGLTIGIDGTIFLSHSTSREFSGVYRLISASPVVLTGSCKFHHLQMQSPYVSVNEGSIIDIEKLELKGTEGLSDFVVHKNASVNIGGFDVCGDLLNFGSVRFYSSANTFWQMKGSSIRNDGYIETTANLSLTGLKLLENFGDINTKGLFIFSANVLHNHKNFTFQKAQLFIRDSFSNAVDATASAEEDLKVVVLGDLINLGKVSGKNLDVATAGLQGKGKFLADVTKVAADSWDGEGRFNGRDVDFAFSKLTGNSVRAKFRGRDTLKLVSSAMGSLHLASVHGGKMILDLTDLSLNIDDLYYTKSLDVQANNFTVKAVKSNGSSDWKVRNVLEFLQDSVILTNNTTIESQVLQLQKLIAASLTAKVRTLKGKIIHATDAELNFDAIADDCAAYEFVAKKTLKLKKTGSSTPFTNTGHLQGESVILQNVLENSSSIVTTASLQVGGNVHNDKEGVLDAPLLSLVNPDQPLKNQGQLTLKELAGVNAVENQGNLYIDQKGLVLDSLVNTGFLDFKDSEIVVQKFTNHKDGTVILGRRTNITDYLNDGSVVAQNKNLRVKSKQKLGQIIAAHGSVVWDVLPEAYDSVLDVSIGSPAAINHSLDIAAKAKDMDEYLSNADKSNPLASLIGFLTFAQTPSQSMFENIGTTKGRQRLEAVLSKLAISKDPFVLMELLDQAAHGNYRQHLADATSVDNALLELLSGAWEIGCLNKPQSIKLVEAISKRLGRNFYQQKLDLSAVEQKVFKSLAKYREAHKGADQALLKTHYENIFKGVTEGFLKAQADDRKMAELVIASATTPPLTVDLEALIRTPIYADYLQVNYAGDFTQQGELKLTSPLILKAKKFWNKGAIAGGLTLVVDEFANGVDNNHMGGIAAEEDGIFIYSLGKADNRFGRIFGDRDSVIEALGGAISIGAVKEVTTEHVAQGNVTPRSNGSANYYANAYYQKKSFNGSFISSNGKLKIISYFDDLYNDYGEIFSGDTSVLRGTLIRNLSGAIRSQTSVYMFGNKYICIRPDQLACAASSPPGSGYYNLCYYVECADSASTEAKEDIFFNLDQVENSYSVISAERGIYKLGVLIAGNGKEYEKEFIDNVRYQVYSENGPGGNQHTHYYRMPSTLAIIRAGEKVTIKGPDKATISGSMSAGLSLTIDVNEIITRCVGRRQNTTPQFLNIDLYEVAKKATGGFFAIKESGRVDTIYPITSRFSYADMPLTTVDGQPAANVAVSETVFEFALQRALAEQVGNLRMDGHSGVALREYLFRNSMAQGSAISLAELASRTVKPAIAMVARQVMGTLQSIPHLLVPAKFVNPYQASGDLYANQMKLLTSGDQVHEGSRIKAKEKLDAIAKGRMQRTSTKYVELDIQKKLTTTTEHLAAQQEMGCEEGDATIVGEQGYTEVGVKTEAGHNLTRGSTHGNTDIRALTLTSQTQSTEKKSGGILRGSKTTHSSSTSTSFVATEASSGGDSTIIGVNIAAAGTHESARNLLEYQAQESVNLDAAVGANSNSTKTTTRGLTGGSTRLANSLSVPAFLQNVLRAQTIKFKAKSANVRGSVLAADTVEDKTVEGAIFGPTIGVMRYAQSVRTRQPLRSSSQGVRGGREVMAPTSIHARRIVRCPSPDRLTEDEQQKARDASMRFISVQKTNAEIIGKYEEAIHELKSWNETWSRSHQVLPNGAIQVLAVATTIASKGMASSIFSTSLGGTMASAGFKCLVSMAATNFAQTGDVASTVKSLASAQGVRSLAISVASAGLLKELSESLKIPLNTKSLELTHHLQTEGLRALVNTSLNVTYDAATGNDPTQSLTQGARGFASGVVGSFGASHLGDIYKNSEHNGGDYALHKLLHFMNGGVAGHILTGDKKGFISGGIGAMASEMILEARQEYLTSKALERLNEASRNGESLTPEKLLEINRLNKQDLESEIDRAQLGTSIIAALLNQDVGIAASIGLTAAKHNFEPTIGTIVGGALLAWGVYEVIDIYRTQGLDKAMEHLAVMGVVTVATAGTGAIVYKIGSKAYPSAILAWNALLTNYPKYGELIGKITGSKAAQTLAKVKNAYDGANQSLARAAQKVGLSKGGGEVTGGGAAAAVAFKSKMHDYSLRYPDEVKNFVGTPKEFEGVLSNPLRVVSYHSDKVIGQGRSVKYWTPVSEANGMGTMDEVVNNLAILNQYGVRTHVSLAEVPAGEVVKFMHGRTAFQKSRDGLEMRPGGGVQYCFEKFDEAWIKLTKPLP